MKSSIRVTLATTFALVSGLASAMAAPAPAAPSNPSVVLVVPSRYAFVKFAQDLAALRAMTVVSFSVTNTSALFVWDAAGAKWASLDAAAFASGTGFDASSHLIVMGTDAATVNILATSAKSWATKVTSLPKFDIVGALNAASETLHFSKSEWEWLSDRYSLSFKDENAERRRYGKYKDRRGEAKAPPAKTAPAPAADVVMPEAIPAPAPAASASAPTRAAEPVAPPAQPVQADAPKAESGK